MAVEVCVCSSVSGDVGLPARLEGIPAMDMYCRKCGEPWDHDELHEVAEEQDTTYERVRDAFLANGCAVFSTRCNGERSGEPSVIGEVFAVLAELGDLDGAMAEIEDLRDMGVF